MSLMRTSRYFAAAALIVLLSATSSLAQPALPVDLGSAETFAVLGSNGVVTNTGATTLVGDFGVFPGTTLPGGVTLFPGASSHAGDAVAALAAYDSGRGRSARAAR